MSVNLVLFKKNGAQKSFSLPGNVTTIGRLPECDLYIPVSSVSRRHCQLNRDQAGVLKIRDLGSRNGTGLNGKPVKEAPISPGDHIKVGPVTFVCQIDGQPRKIGGQGPSHKNTSNDDSNIEDLDTAILEELDELESLDEDDST